MADEDTGRSKMPSGCFTNMREMMRNMMSGKGGPCCCGPQTTAGMTPECCAAQAEKESPKEKQAREAPK